MKPNPFASLNHFTFPVVRIPNSFVVIDAGSGITPTLTIRSARVGGARPRWTDPGLPDIGPNRNPRTRRKYKPLGKRAIVVPRGPPRPSVADAAHPDHIVVRLAKTARGHSPVLLVLELHAAFGHGVVDRHCDRIAAHGKREDLRHRPRHVHHRQFPFPRFAEPALARELLDEPHTLSAGVREIQRNAGPNGEDQ